MEILSIYHNYYHWIVISFTWSGESLFSLAFIIVIVIVHSWTNFHYWLHQFIAKRVNWHQHISSTSHRLFFNWMLLGSQTNYHTFTNQTIYFHSTRSHRLLYGRWKHRKRSHWCGRKNPKKFEPKCERAHRKRSRIQFMRSPNSRVRTMQFEHGAIENIDETTEFKYIVCFEWLKPTNTYPLQWKKIHVSN